ncbi:MAG: CdaR family protein, partial [Oscillospiraceae bacterium]|nr:CdaR family protein [Oscillospiraceae bacterium]
MTRRALINKILNGKLFWIIVSVIISVLLWMFVTTTEGSEISAGFSGIKVEFIGETALRESRGLIVTGVENNSVSVRLSGNRRAISALSDHNIIAQIDLSTVSRPGLMQWPYTLTYPAGVNPNDITVVNRFPQVITFTVDNLRTKTVEFRGRLDGTV